MEGEEVREEDWAELQVREDDMAQVGKKASEARKGDLQEEEDK